MTRAAFVLNVLRLQGIEVGRATGEIKVKEGTHPAGSLVVKRNQPNLFAYNLFNRVGVLTVSTGGTTGGIDLVNSTMPRTIGLEFRKKF